MTELGDYDVWKTTEDARYIDAEDACEDGPCPRCEVLAKALGLSRARESEVLQQLVAIAGAVNAADGLGSAGAVEALAEIGRVLGEPF